eukprot:4805639-Alexandrium_andersonii.AAC.1
MHANHLIVKYGLCILDACFHDLGVEGTYFAGIAKIINTWRAHSWAVWNIWTKRFPIDTAMKFAKVMPPRCIAGRWG